VGDPLGVLAAGPEALGDLGEVAGGLLRDLGGLEAGLSSSGAVNTSRRVWRACEGSSAARSSSVIVVSTGLRLVKLVRISIRSRSLTIRSGGLPRSSL
jgi:hypothetical protein